MKKLFIVISMVLLVSGLVFGGIADAAPKGTLNVAIADFSYETFDPNQMGGQACIRGLRIPVATVVRSVASGMSNEEILEAYPDLEQEDISEALRYAATLTEDRVIPLKHTSS